MNLLHYYFPPAQPAQSRKVDVDVCAYGSSPGAIMAALQAARHDHSVALVVNSAHLGGLTASGLGERLGESSGSTSYHLRQLERVGLVQEKVGKGNARERWWERHSGSITFPDPGDFPAGSADRLTARLLGEEALRGRDQAFREFIAQDDDAISEEWQRVSVVDTINLKLLPDQLQSFVLEFDEPLQWDHVAHWLDALVIGHGNDLLRVKGILDIVGRDRPIVVQAVQSLFYPPFDLPAWPEGVRKSRIVFITRNLSRAFVQEVLDTIRQRPLPRAGGAGR